MPPHGECDGHDHDYDDEDGLGLSLRPSIDFSKVVCLNEEEPGSGKAVLKLHEERLSTTPSLLSPEGDPELLLVIPFNEAVTVKKLSIHDASTSTETASPRRIKIFTDRVDLDFDTARELNAQQEFDLVPAEHLTDGTVDYPLRPAGRFSNINSLIIFFEDNYDDSGEAATEITFIGLKGKGSGIRRKAVDTVYESRPVPKDHQVKGGEFGSSTLI